MMIAAPQKDLSEEEAQKIITYMEAGGKVMIFTEYTGTDMPNLKSVLENYGVTTGDGVIMEGDTGHYIMQRPYYIVPTIDSSDITSDIKSNNRYVLAPISQPVKTLSDYRDTLQISSLLSTSDKAYIKTDVQNMTTYEKEDSDEEGSFQVGVSVTEQVMMIIPHSWCVSAVPAFWTKLPISRYPEAIRIWCWQRWAGCVKTMHRSSM